ncbi:MAG: prolipoprotein diacylglyceryl transferase [Planctomycetes bacterium]|nr:prolipoprotein diacylglyceryl transferase [Planctomycetota bacterium]
MLAALNHPRLIYDWFTTVLLRWSRDGLVVYERWLLNFSGVSDWQRGAGGSVILDFYYLMYLFAFVGVLVLMNRYRKLGWFKVQPHVPYDALLLAMIGVLVGAKTAYSLIYNPDFYFGAPPVGPATVKEQLNRIFLNWSGMASHGAATGVAVMAFFWWLKSRAPVSHIGDLGCMSGALGAVWIRLANFMNGELYGRAAPDWLPWAMRFPVRSGHTHPVVFSNGELYERIPKPEDPAQVEQWLTSLKAVNPDGVLEHGSYVLYRNPDAYRQGWEVMTQGPNGPEFVSPDAPGHLWFGDFPVVTTPRHPSQIYQLVLEGLLLFLFLLFLRRRVKRTGVIAGAFFMGYALARFIGEFFRQPDVQFQQQGNDLGTVFLGLSMGQVLSLAMAVFGLGFMLYFHKRGRVIAEMPLWPPKAEKTEKEAKPALESDPKVGGSTAAGTVEGLDEVRAALARKEAEWEKERHSGPQSSPKDQS